MDQPLDRRLRFDRFVLDLVRGTVRVGGEEITLRPKTFDVLRHLAENAGRLVLKQDLHATVWPDVAVTDDSLVQCIRELRQTLGDDDHRLIKTVSRRGYLLDSELRKPTSDHAFSEAAPSHPSQAHEARKLGVRWPVGSRERSAIILATVLFGFALGVIFLQARTAQPPVSLTFTPAHVPASSLNRLFT